MGVTTVNAVATLFAALINRSARRWDIQLCKLGAATAILYDHDPRQWGGSGNQQYHFRQHPRTGPHLTQTAGGGASANFTNTGTLTTTTANTNGILGDWATYRQQRKLHRHCNLGRTTAMALGLGNVVAYTGYTALSAAASTGYTNAQLSSTANYLTGNPTINGANFVSTTTGTGTVTINSLTMQGDFSINSGLTLVIGSGGLVMNGSARWITNNNVGSTAGTGKLTGQGLASGELFVDVADAQYIVGG